MITIESKGNNIFLFGRDGEKIICEQKQFEPYFFIEDENGKEKSIMGKNLTKVKCSNPFEIIQKREMFPITYESDVLYVNRYIIDNIKDFKEEKIRKCFLDIEIRKPKGGFDEPFKASSEILCIGCYDNFTNKYMQYMLSEYESEKEMLLKFIDYFKETNPDMIIAWNGDNFDFPFLLNRIGKLGINANSLARQTNTFKGETHYRSKYGMKIEGRILFDLLYAYKKWTSGEGRESFSLDYISKYEKIGKKEEYEGSLDELYERDKEQYKQYNLKDVELMVELDKKLGLIEFFNKLRKITYCRFEDVFMNSKMADCLCLRYAKEHGFILPSINKKTDTTKYKGGLVQNSTPGLHKQVACLDMKSLYPSIMIGFNTSYETLLDKHEDGCINGNDKYFFKREKGIIPAIVKPLLDRRAIVKKELKQLEADSREYKSKYMEQYTLKTIANSFYGVLGYKNFRLYKREVASAITFLARTTIKEISKWFLDRGYVINYGDTDSVFISMNGKTVEEFEQVTKDINKYLLEYYTKFGVPLEDNIIELQFEKVYKTIFFKQGNGRGIKKKYAGILMWEDGKFCDKYQRKGFESRRSDSPQIGRDFLDDVLKKIVTEKPKEEIEEYIEIFKNKILTEFTPEEMAIPIGISKPLHKYKNQIHARASRLANERHNEGIQSGDKIKYIYVKNEGKVIAFKSDNKMPEGYTIDYENMIRRIINLKVGPIFDSLGWNHNYTTKLITKKSKHNLLKNILTQKELW